MGGFNQCASPNNIIVYYANNVYIILIEWINNRDYKQYNLWIINSIIHSIIMYYIDIDYVSIYK